MNNLQTTGYRSIFAFCLFCVCLPPLAQPLRFAEQAQEKGLHFIQQSGALEKRYIVHAKGAGVAVADVNNDGWDDIYLLNGASITAPITESSPRNQLFLNRKDGTFRNATEWSGLGDPGLSLSAAFADVDNDGDLDGYIANYGPNALYLNDGGGRFVQIENAGGAQNPGMSTGLAFADITGDGFLDLFVGQYAEFSKALADQLGPMMDYFGLKAFLGPKYFPPSSDNLFINNGDGTFRDETEKRGINAFQTGRAFTAMFSDLDDDGDLDLYVANDTTANHLYFNQGHGHFEEMALLTGTALSEHGQAQGGMGLAIEDYNNDSRLDIAVTNYEAQYNILYQGSGRQNFSDVSFTSGFYQGGVPYVGFGLIMEDFDNDGWQDVHIANGHVYPQADKIESKKGYAQTDLFYHNEAEGRLCLLDTKQVLAGTAEGVSRGSAYADFDRDGDLDIVVNHLDAPAHYYDNRLITHDQTPRQGGNFLQIAVQNQHGMPAYGARVTVQSASFTQVKELRSSASFLSQSSAVLHFGLGASKEIEQLQIRWPDRTEKILKSIAGNQRITIRQ